MYNFEQFKYELKVSFGYNTYFLPDKKVFYKNEPLKCDILIIDNNGIKIYFIINDKFDSKILYACDTEINLVKGINYNIRNNILIINDKIVSFFPIKYNINFTLLSDYDKPTYYFYIKDNIFITNIIDLDTQLVLNIIENNLKNKEEKGIEMKEKKEEKEKKSSGILTKIFSFFKKKEDTEMKGKRGSLQINNLKDLKIYVKRLMKNGWIKLEGKDEFTVDEILNATIKESCKNNIKSAIGNGKIKLEDKININKRMNYE